MRVALMFGAFVAAVFAAQPSHARYEGPWCAHISLGSMFVENRCYMVSYEMCRAEIFAMPGAYCTENPHYVPSARGARKKAKRSAR